jgi:hypothetical protein
MPHEIARSSSKTRTDRLDRCRAVAALNIFERRVGIRGEAMTDRISAA